MSNGYFSVQGYQTETPQGGRSNLGPFNVPFGAAVGIVAEDLSTGTTAFAVPSGVKGVAVIPPIGSPPASVTLKVKTVSGDSGIFVSTEYPTIIEFDTVNNEVPATIYLVVAGGSIEVCLQFL